MIKPCRVEIKKEFLKHNSAGAASPNLLCFFLYKIMEKKSFILHTDLVFVLRKMPVEQRGDLFLKILEYANGNEIDTNDLIVDLTFEPIKCQLDRDLIKYKSTIERQVANGKLGGRPPKNSQNNSETQNNPLVSEITQNNPLVFLETQKTQAFLNKPKKADSDSDSDSDNVNDNVKNKYNIESAAKAATQKTESSLNVKKLYNEFVSTLNDGWNKPIVDWLKYKMERKEYYRSERSLSTLKTHLNAISDGNIDIATEIVNQSIANGYKGLFKRNKNGKNNNGIDRPSEAEFIEMVELGYANAAAQLTNKHL